MIFDFLRATDTHLCVPLLSVRLRNIDDQTRKTDGVENVLAKSCPSAHGIRGLLQD
ncbi:hypothetical protein AOX55_00001684 [Sinorhizobium fredii CCBAU 25509]|nr:hypothetical protein AOX55_00001684 [Sinorhizobium fredii CCBAU 25509]